MGDELLDRLADAECARAEVEAAVTVGLAADEDADVGPPDADARPSEAAVPALLVLRRGSGGGAATVTEVAGTTLFTVEVSAEGPPALRAGSDVAAVPLRLAPARCDPHAVAESKRGYAFPVWVSVAGGEPVHLTVAPGDDLRERLDRLLADVCGLTGAPAPAE